MQDNEHKSEEFSEIIDWSYGNDGKLSCKNTMNYADLSRFPYKYNLNRHIVYL